MKTLYSKNSISRKAKYSLSTVIEEDRSGLFVRKVVVSPEAKDHLNSIVTNYKILKRKLEPFVNVVEACKEGDSIIFPFIEGVNLQTEFIRKFIDGKEKEAKEVLLLFKNTLYNLPSKKENLCRNIEFRSKFGELEDKVFDCLEVGCLDLNLDNLILKDGKLYLIDYEWVFHTPLPKDFLYFRTIIYSFFSIRDYLELKSSKAYPLVEVLPKIFIPLNFYKNEKKILDKADEFYQLEMNFQAEVNITNNDRVKKDFKMKIFETPLVNNFFNKIDTYKYFEEKVVEKENKIKEVEEELDKYRNELSSIYNSKAWKVITKLINIKSRTSKKR